MAQELKLHYSHNINIAQDAALVDGFSLPKYLEKAACDVSVDIRCPIALAQVCLSEDVVAEVYHEF